MNSVRLVIIILLASFFISCESDSYDKGEGDYSLMHTDMAELYVDSQKQGTSFTTDDGDTYHLSPFITGKWITTADTTYRTIIYYNKVSDQQVTPLGINQVVTLEPVEYWRFKEQPQDPIGVESAWMARSGRYLNLGLLVKTGRVSDEELPHNIGLAQDTLYQRPDGRRTACYRLLHSQNGIPQYYTNRRFVSILLPQPAPDTIRLSVITFDGVLEREFVKK